MAAKSGVHHFRFRDLTGQKVGRWTVLELAPKNGRKDNFWRCRCDCGKEREVVAFSLNKGLTLSCGCIRSEQVVAEHDITGQRFGRWTVESKESAGRWWCVCACGTRRVVQATSMRAGGTLSCGCYKNERVVDVKTVHGHNRKGKRTKEYGAWSSMRRRCYCTTSQDYPAYGGRGITMCDSWRESFQAFLDDVGEAPSKQHSIHRIDNDKGYETGNVCWALPKTQSRKTRRSHMLTFDGRTQSISAWAEEVGIGESTLWFRIHNGWDVGEALTKPLQVN